MQYLGIMSCISLVVFLIWLAIIAFVVCGAVTIDCGMSDQRLSLIESRE